MVPPPSSQPAFRAWAALAAAFLLSLYLRSCLLCLVSGAVAVAVALHRAQERRGLRQKAFDEEAGAPWSPGTREPEREPELVPKSKLRISGFEKAMKTKFGTPRRVPAASLRSGVESAHRILSDLDSPPMSERSEKSIRFDASARSQASARSARSDASQRVIDDLQAQIAKLKEEKHRTPRSARSESSQAIIDDLQSQMAGLKEELSKQPDSARSASSQAVISDLRAQIQQLEEQKKQSETPRSARSEKSQSIINDLQATIAGLKERQTPRSARSTASQTIIDDLQAQLQKLNADKSRACETPRSARSETSQAIIEDMQAQIRQLEEEVQAPVSARSDSSQGVIKDLQAQLQAFQPPMVPLQNMLRSLQLQVDYEKLLEDEGIEFVDDLAGYDEAELVALGMKRAHVKRLLRAASVGSAAVISEEHATPGRSWSI